MLSQIRSEKIQKNFYFSQHSVFRGGTLSTRSTRSWTNTHQGV